MLDLSKISKNDPILAIGNYPAIIQSILDFDYLSGKKDPSIVGIVAAGRKTVRYFFGKKEILLPVYESIIKIPKEKKDSIRFFLNLSSGRRVLASSQEALEHLPALLGGVIFAEGVPEQHAIQLFAKSREKNVFIVGPSSIGLIIPGVIKCGPIGGTESRQLIDSRLFEKGDTAVLSSSGGMTNEIIRIVILQKRRISFSLSFGGERFPVLSPKEAFLAAEKDSNTKTIVYFGELGGGDEYELASLIEQKKVTKEVICYIAGVVAEIFETPPQFGHAKAMAKTNSETAQAKKRSTSKGWC